MIKTKITYQYDNHLGSASLELDENAAILSYEEYHPFGTTSYRSGRTETEKSLKRYKYVGKERDEESGLYYYGARYYAGWLCRFVSVDPLQHDYPYYTPYQYAGNKPISFVDLDGKEPALPDHIKPSDRLGGPGKHSDLTYGDVLNILNISYQQIMKENYIREDGKGGHEFDYKRWYQENIKEFSKDDVNGYTEKGLEARDAYKSAKASSLEIINSKEYNVFFHNSPIEFGNSSVSKQSGSDSDAFVIGNWFPVAISLTADASAAYGISASGEAGGILILQGLDAGEFYGFSDYGIGGGGSSASFSGKVSLFFTTGDISKLQYFDFGGSRTEFNAGGGVAFLKAGISASIGKYNQTIEGKIFSVGVNFGTVGNVLELGFDYNYGGERYKGVGGTTITNLFYED